MSKKRSSSDSGDKPARSAGKSKAEPPNKSADEAPFVLTLRDVQVPLPSAEPVNPVDSGLVLSDFERQPEPYLGDPDADRAAQRAARRAEVRRERQRDVAADEQPSAPGVLVLSRDEGSCSELCALLSAFGFSVQVMAEPPGLAAPWPFVAVFITMPITTADGGDAIDLCNQVRESSRLPGQTRPLLVLAAQQVSATDRVRAGLAGCHEILIGAVTRGGVAQLLDARGIALPSDARRS
jgi:hypothetical protein